MKKTLVVFYSWSGHAKQMAGIIADKTGADVMELFPQTSYSQNYGTAVAQAKADIGKDYRPPLQPLSHDPAEYDVVYVGTPIWHGTMAPPVATFLRDADWAGKTVLPFSTHGGGGKGRADRDMKRLCPGADLREMFTAYEGGGRTAKQEIEAWIQRNEGRN